MPGEVKRVAVIGGGCSGLAAIKSCVDEGLQPVCYERTDQLGGLWNYTQHVREGQGCVMRSTVINTSKEMMCYSDFPIPQHYPNFMHNSQVWQYFQDYAKHFDLNQHITYNTEVLLVKPAPDFDDTGRWNLKVLDHKSDEENTETFDAVLVCTGHHAQKNEPSFPGLADFKGEVIHSHDYREPSRFMDKRMLIIGIGNSGGDMAVELSRQGQVYLSTRRGTWVIHRISEPGGQPIDILNTKRWKLWLANSIPPALLNKVICMKLNHRLDHDLYSLRPAYPPTAQHPMVNDDLGNRIACGKVKVKTDVIGFTATGVEFEDGSFEDDIDVVFLATGYRFGFPFLDKSVVDVKENRLPFYKYMFPPDQKHHTLAIIGCIQPLGAIMPIAELQCRLAARVFKGDVKLPSASEMWEDIQAKETAMAKRYVKSPRHTIQVDYLGYMDEIALLNGCKPDFLTLVKRDPALAWQVWTGPCTPYQFRLTGPGQWDGARDAIMSTMDRVRYPFATRPLPVISDMARVQGFMSRLLMLFAFLLVLSVVFG
ncbi:flavin-containing monooxygenase 5-like [Littorina saxatilis]|uniref:Flavin-containing monooxygenase n=1 Tax=Littorina saxatilis TaxID=31220 RepID=A0AAN9G4Q3_9CAEN